MAKVETIHLVVFNDYNVNKHIRLLRRRTSKSIGDIRENILMGKPVIKCSYSNKGELECLVLSAEELIQMGASIKIYESEEEITLLLVKNLIKTIEGIKRDREQTDDLMFDEE